ncbi:hypothetical protein Mapa_017082 [Marchantia paleacea]|nr:hypothetical protein Mapa_017082 [Marchantia paleacea]
MSSAREERYKYSEPVSSTNLGNDAQSDSRLQNTETVVTEKLNIYGGRTVKTSRYQRSGANQSLISYTIIEYDEKEMARSRKVFDSRGCMISN